MSDRHLSTLKPPRLEHAMVARVCGETWTERHIGSGLFKARFEVGALRGPAATEPGAIDDGKTGGYKKRHREPKAKQSSGALRPLDCCVAVLLAMTAYTCQ